jgi:hypothetical protein
MAPFSAKSPQSHRTEIRFQSIFPQPLCLLRGPDCSLKVIMRRLSNEIIRPPIDHPAVIEAVILLEVTR